MAQEIAITVIGALVGDPELRFTQSGTAVASFTVANNPRFFDKNTNQWKDGDPNFMRCNIWRDQAENAVESFVKGDRVIVVGSLKQRSFETKDGEKRSVWELDVDEMGASVKFGTARQRKTTRARSEKPAETSEPATETRSRRRPSKAAPETPPPVGDPWESTGVTNEPPF